MPARMISQKYAASNKMNVMIAVRSAPIWIGRSDPVIRLQDLRHQEEEPEDHQHQRNRAHQVHVARRDVRQTSCSETSAPARARCRRTSPPTADVAVNCSVYCIPFHRYGSALMTTEKSRFIAYFPPLM